MKKITCFICIILCLSIQAQTQSFIEIQDGTRIDCATLNNLLVANNTVCLIKSEPTTDLITVRIIDDENSGPNPCDAVNISTDQELRIPANVNIILRNGKSFNMSGAGRITGEHVGTSTITIGPDDNLDSEELVAIDMENCTGCEVSNVTITKSNNEDNGTGIVVDETSSGNEISSVKFENIESGILVRGSANTFNDLEFFQLGTDSLDCDPVNNENILAIKMEGASQNEFVNVLHTRSPGAVTFWIEGLSNDNTILNVSVEQENSHCTILLDPSIYIENPAITGNIITTNLNHGTVIVNNNQTELLCGQNSISSLRILDQDGNPTLPCEGATNTCPVITN